MKKLLRFMVLMFSIYISTNLSFSQWIQTNGPLGGDVYAFAILPNATGGTNLFAGLSGAGVFLSTNNGTSWTQVNNGLMNMNVTTFAVSGTNLFAGTSGGGVFLSTNNGTSWTAVNNGLTNMVVTALAISGTSLFAAMQNSGVFLSTNNGINWTKVDVGLSNNEKENITAFVTSGSNIFALSWEGVYLFNHNNNSWASYLFDNNNIVYVTNCMAITGSNIIVGQPNGYIFHSTDYGITWTNTQLATKSSIYSLLVNGTNVYMGTLDGGIFLSTDNGMSWTQMNSGLETRTVVRALAVSPNGAGGTNIFAGTSAGVFHSSDSGANWTQCNNGLICTSVSSIGISQNVQGGEKIYAGTYGGGVFLSTNSGIDYTQINNGFVFTQSILFIYSLAISNTDIFAGTAEGNVYHSTDGGTNWIKIYKPSGSGSISSLLISSANLFAGQIGGYVCRSTDNGSNWTKVFSIVPHKSNTNVFLANSAANIFAGTYGGIVYLSTDNGSSWTNASIGGTNSNVQSLAISDTNLFAGTDSAGVFLSTNNGTSWTAVNNGLTNMYVTAFAVSGTNLFAGTSGGGVFLSTNNGTSWNAVNNGLTNMYVLSLAVSGTNLYVGTDLGGVYKRPLANFNSLKAPILTSPSNGAIGVSTNSILSWKDSSSVISYRLQVSISSSFSPLILDSSGITGTSYSISGLAKNTTYYWRVSAANDIGTSIYSNTSSFTTIVASPAMPILASPSNSATGVSTNPTLRWKDSSSVTSYRLQLSTNFSFLNIFFDKSNITDTLQQVNGLANSTTYYWRVNATNAGGTSLYSNTFSFTTIVALPAPPILDSPSNGMTSVSTNPTLSWKDSSSVSSYRLQVSTSSNFSPLFIDSSGITGTSFSVSGLAKNTTYYWRVSATNAGGTSSYYSTWSFTTIVAAPVIPTLTTPSNNATGVSTNPTLSWTDSSSVTSYRLQLSTSSSYSSLILDSSGIMGTSYSISGLAKKTTYYWRVCATNAGGTSSYSISWSFTTIVTALSIPTLTTPSNGATNVSTNPTLSWKDSSSVTSYRLQVSTSFSFSSLIIDSSGITGTSYSVSGLTKNTTYYWRVSAVNASDTSSYSSISSFTTGTTSVEQIDLKVPATYNLGQNYPNPFNPNTTIQFSLPKETYVSLKIYNNVGQEVAMLVSQYLGAGIYTTELNAAGFPSGVYFYRLQAGSFIETKKFVLLR